jgi:3-oxoacyl-[acyl-carrier-protein] synthase III
MSINVYITKAAKFLPNAPVQNDEMEDYLGLIKGLKSKSKPIILRNNGIKCRYYAIDKNGVSTHSNADLTAEAVKKLEDNNFSIEDIQLLTCGSASPDLLLPSLASTVQGKLKMGAIDVMSAAGSCNSSIWGLNYAWMSLITGKYSNAVCTGSEKQSTSMRAPHFEEESKHLESLGKNPYIAFEKDFLRWMLSDGAAAVLLEDKPNNNGLSLRIDWIEIKSYSSISEPCMYAGGVKNDKNEITPWRDLRPEQLINNSAFALKQDSRLLEKYITDTGGIFLKDLINKGRLKDSEIDHFLPHISSGFFRQKIMDSLLKYDINIDESKWFTNLDKIGNVGAASAFMMLEEILCSEKIRRGDRILLMVPESASFSYSFVHFTAV